MNRSIDFFEDQFRRQTEAGGAATEAGALNPFEQRALPYLAGRVLDYGCGLGNLALEAARRGCVVTALDAAPTAIGRLREIARVEALPVTAIEADLRDHVIDGEFDAVVTIGLLMFFDCASAWRQLGRLAAAVAPGGIIAVNVLIEGTSFREMFDPRAYCLFAEDALRERFVGWQTQADAVEEFPAPGGTVKRFATLIARRPGSAPPNEAQTFRRPPP